jgi:phage gp46-like protein
MTDLALVPFEETLDLGIEGGDLVLDEGLRTPVLVSVFTDGLAAADDELPDGTTDRRGWWAAGLLETDGTSAFGSRLWTLARSKLTDPTLATLEELAREALDWIVARGVADEVLAEAFRIDVERAAVNVELVRGPATERAGLWEGELGAPTTLGGARVSILARP